MTGAQTYSTNRNALAPQIPRALIADDQPDVLAALHLLLRGAGYQTEAVNSPAALLQAIRERNFDLVLMDLNYERDTTSGREGLDLITRIRSLDSTLPVMVLTGWASVELAVEAMHRGVRDFVQKPWDNSRLLKSVRTQIEVGRRRRQKRAASRTVNASLRLELSEAREIQEALLPKELPSISGFDLAFAWKPASAVGGDYFDVIELSDRHTAICIADVAGKGMPAALVMSNMQAVLKSTASDVVSPAQLCERVNSIVCDNIVANRFISFFYAILDNQTRKLSYVNAGHCPPMLMRDSGCLRMKEGGPVLGIFPNHRYVQEEVELISGDRLVLFTDGVTEARNSSDKEFGELRLQEILREGRKLRAGELRDRIMETVSGFSGGFVHDDAALMVLTVE
ncbi:MAG TPA: SpoIIE family protein phosphatase [Pyrinomonadaceae bacterium]|nr:SpoIIE family protein phosphatase [Pyrinomonadaceae bacterium]